MMHIRNLGNNWMPQKKRNTTILYYNKRGWTKEFSWESNTWFNKN
jgi:hypothetical protein